MTDQRKYLEGRTNKIQLPSDMEHEGKRQMKSDFQVVSWINCNMPLNESGNIR